MTKRIHLATTVLAISLLVLLGSLGNAQAQGFYRRWAFCESARCIKVTGYAVYEFDGDGITTTFTGEKSVEPAILMVDLVNRYIVLDSTHYSVMQSPISIHYAGFNIYIHSVVYGHIIIGVAGTAYVSFTEWRASSSTISSKPPFTAVYFYGLASFYTRLEDNPMWPPPPP